MQGSSSGIVLQEDTVKGLPRFKSFRYATRPAVPGIRQRCVFKVTQRERFPTRSALLHHSNAVLPDVDSSLGITKVLTRHVVFSPICPPDLTALSFPGLRTDEAWRSLLAVSNSWNFAGQIKRKAARDPPISWLAIPCKPLPCTCSCPCQPSLKVSFNLKRLFFS
jgi:hypothetical protein